MTKKNDNTQSGETPLPVYDAELIEDEEIQPVNTNISRREPRPPAYVLGRIVGQAGSVLISIFEFVKYIKSSITPELSRKTQAGKGRRRKCRRNK